MATTQDVQLGIVPESTYGTAVTVTRFLEPIDESLKYNKTTVQGKGVRTGSRVARSPRRVITRTDASGDFTVEALSKSHGTLWQACLGTGTSTLVSGTTFQQNFTPTTTNAVMPSMTVQKGVVASDGTVYAHTFAGMCVNEWEFTAPQADIATLKVSWDGRSMATATALATASFVTSPSIFHFAQAATTLGGVVTVPTATALASGGTSVTNIRSFSLKCSNNLTTDRFTFGLAGLKSQPTVGLRDITGSMTIEYTDNTVRDAFIADTELAFTATFTSTEALSTGTATLQIVCPAIRLDGDLPDANGTDLVTVDVPFTVLDNLVAASPLYVVIRTADTAL